MSPNSEERELRSEVAKDDDPYLCAMLLCHSQVFPAVVNAAIDINLFNIIAKAESSCDSTLSASQIASLFPNQHPQLANCLERILPLLASYSLLDCSIRTNQDATRERVYSLSPVGKYFAFDTDGSSLASLATVGHHGYHYLWTNVKDAITKPNCNTHFENVYGLPIYQYMETNADLNHMFKIAMAQSSPIAMKRVIQSYKGFEGVSTLVDVGGGVGETLKLILSAYPSIKGINFDLPQMIQHALPHPGIEHIGGDMFKSVPNGGDAILLKTICHNWPDEDCIKFLKNCRKVLPPHGKVIVLEYILPEVPTSSGISKFTFGVDNAMMLAHGAKERTANEFEILCKNSGFSKFHLASDGISFTVGVMEFYK
ncbi:hypothetical protein Fmac_001210 [Flemingia macrophylla]|uniref:Uncharacterized protein n=1 Tax=Flemingia macrophylla TaxID=520843 RepID=A0ABD1NJ90_9FABA